MKYDFLPGKAQGMPAFGKEDAASGVYVTSAAFVGALGF
jgi:hypothetical protein